MSHANKIEALRAKTVEHGATAAEEKAATALADRLEASDEARREAALEALDGLVDESIADVIARTLPRLPPWQAATDWRWPLLFDWCSAKGNLDPHDLRTQLRFLVEDLTVLRLWHPADVEAYCEKLG